MMEISVAFNSTPGGLPRRAEETLRFLVSGMLYALRKAMLWMEMIQLRTTQEHLKSAADVLLDAAKHVTGEDGLVRVHTYGSASFKTDLALSLTWDTTSPEHRGSRVALSISDALKNFGLVEHSIWLEKGVQ